MIYRGRELDAVSLWSQFVDFPANMSDDSGFAPLVKCPNPEHQTDKRHFQINLDDPLVHCFALCGISGTFEHAISMIKGVTEREARKIIVQHTRLAVGKVGGVSGRRKRGKRHAANPDAEHVSLDYQTYLPQGALEYLDGRGIHGAAIARFAIGWDDKSLRVVVPARDERGETRFLIKRAIRPKDFPKYLYDPPGASKTAILFGACDVDGAAVRSSGLALVEGSFGAINLQQHGHPTGAILGTGLSPEQKGVIDKLRPPRIYLVFDPDTSGVKNVLRARDMLTKYPLYVCLHPKGRSGPDELTKEEADHSFENALPLMQFMRRLPKKYQTRSMTRR